MLVYSSTGQLTISYLDSLDHAVHEEGVGRKGSSHDVDHGYSEKAPRKELQEDNNYCVQNARPTPSLQFIVFKFSQKI